MGSDAARTRSMMGRAACDIRLSQSSSEHIMLSVSFIAERVRSGSPTQVNSWSALLHSSSGGPGGGAGVAQALPATVSSRGSQWRGTLNSSIPPELMAMRLPPSASLQFRRVCGLRNAHPRAAYPGGVAPELPALAPSHIMIPIAAERVQSCCGDSPAQASPARPGLARPGPPQPSQA